MHDKFVLGVDKNSDYLVDFVSYILNSRASSFPKLSLPILDNNDEIPDVLTHQRLILERHERINNKLKFFNKCLQRPPLRSEIYNQRARFRYLGRHYERFHAKESSANKRNVGYSNIDSNPIFKYYSNFTNRDITPLRERVCMACRKNSLTKHNNAQEKNKSSKACQNIPQDSSKTNVCEQEKTHTISELLKHLYISRKTNNLESIIKEAEMLDESNNELKTTLKKTQQHLVPTVITNSNIINSPPRKAVREISVCIKNTDTSIHDLNSNSEYHTRRESLQIINTDPIGFNTSSLSSILPIERLSI